MSGERSIGWMSGK